MVLNRRVIFAACFVGCLAAGCRKSPEDVFRVPEAEVSRIVKDLGPWVGYENLPKQEKLAFRRFCKFLAVRYQCDDEVRRNQMTEKEAVEATQPIIDDLAAIGGPMENVLIKLLKERKGASPRERMTRRYGEDPEIFATIVLWHIKSKRAVPLLMQLARDSDYSTRAVFVRALGRIGDPRALNLLADLAANDRSEEVRNEARLAVEEIRKSAPAKSK